MQSPFVSPWRRASAAGPGRPAPAVKEPESRVVSSLLYSNGDSYRGHVVDGKRNGWGVYRYAAGAACLSYHGYWRRNAKDGSGVLLWRSGAVYSGGWRSNAMHGFGVYFDDKGTSYQGQFQNGICTGLGMFLTPTSSYFGWMDGGGTKALPATAAAGLAAQGSADKAGEPRRRRCRILRLPTAQSARTWHSYRATRSRFLHAHTPGERTHSLFNSISSVASSLGHSRAYAPPVALRLRPCAKLSN
eukprot:GHVT01088762.1.p1 GENE.GHVT01088762.1~~GHVT01088762.1.p1  ORF type:complete len:245 (+),score=47.60 GHVT01088762.1:576-1310(+)